MANILTKKEFDIIQDLLMIEEVACKKARLYSKILTNKKLAENLKKLADNHLERFNALLEII